MIIDNTVILLINAQEYMTFLERGHYAKIRMDGISVKTGYLELATTLNCIPGVNFRYTIFLLGQAQCNFLRKNSILIL